MRLAWTDLLFVESVSVVLTSASSSSVYLSLSLSPFFFLSHLLANLKSMDWHDALSSNYVANFTSES